ncbi:MAG: hypothetical protein ACD_41C00349G0008 [uncultured bacterium]|nr:MAG: hypothetical protein ACD_41C00349G0008 [uncultured bacterium]HBY73176.1 hypothetical protein [Candidatus Kerfeldbacteria bacterium]
MHTLIKLSSGLVIAGFAFAAIAADGDFDDGDFGDGEFEEGGDVPVADNTSTASVENLGPFGGNLWDVALSPDGSKLYTVAKDSPNGFYWSDDGGATWNGLSGVDYGGGIGVEVDTDGNVYTTFSQGLYKSTDEGVTFTRILEDNGNALLVIGDTLFMSSTSTPGTIHTSADGGESFTTTTLPNSEDIWSMAITAGAVYVQTMDSDYVAHLYKSTDDGENWTELSIPAMQDTSAAVHVCVNGSDASVVGLTGGFSGEDNYLSTNGGSSWVGTGTNSVTSWCVFDTAERLYMGEMYSDDLANWESLGADDSETTALGGHFLLVDPNDVDMLYADGMPGLSKSTDRGQTWEDINEGISGVTITDISQATDKDIVWAAAYNGIAKTQNFTSTNPTWEFPVLEDPGTAIWVDPSDPNMVVVGEIGAIRRTTDGGSSWTANDAADLLSHDYSVDEILADVTDANTLYAAVENGEPNNSKVGMVLRSTDKGETWEDLAITDNVSAQTITQASDGRLYVGVGADAGSDYLTGIYVYENDSWTALDGTPEEDIVKILVDPDDDTIIYAVGTSGFYRSNDSGNSWDQITDGIDELRSFNSLAIQSSTTPNTLYLGATNFFNQGVLYKSTDGGDTWGLQYTGLQEETFYTLIFDGVTAGTSRGLFEIKSKAALTVKAAKKKVPVLKKAEFTVTLKDGVTGKKLKNQRVKFFQKSGKKFEKIDTVKTNKKGQAIIEVRIRKAKQYQFKATWKPKGGTSEEYTNATSSIVKVKGTN